MGDVEDFMFSFKATKNNYHFLFTVPIYITVLLPMLLLFAVAPAAATTIIIITTAIILLR